MFRIAIFATFSNIDQTQSVQYTLKYFQNVRFSFINLSSRMSATFLNKEKVCQYLHINKDKEKVTIINVKHMKEHFYGC